jgi:hypothetical protein
VDRKKKTEMTEVHRIIKEMLGPDSEGKKKAKKRKEVKIVKLKYKHKKVLVLFKSKLKSIVYKENCIP